MARPLRVAKAPREDFDAEDTAPAASPHPGFDRIRALAAQRGQLSTGAAKKVRKPAAGAGGRAKPSKTAAPGKKSGGSKGAGKKPGRGAPGKRKR
ncbi:hypothetical protein [Corallococcus sp. 4LFB]|uniref:hypothetical protein n=1 Tax=Corallococcus sp. 4LFB TaxID=3383249 RepID=UPI003975BB88